MLKQFKKSFESAFLPEITRIPANSKSRNLDKNPFTMETALYCRGLSMRKSIALLLVLVFLIASCIIKSLPVKAGPRTIVVPDDYTTIGAAMNASSDG